MMEINLFLFLLNKGTWYLLETAFVALQSRPTEQARLVSLTGATRSLYFYISLTPSSTLSSLACKIRVNGDSLVFYYPMFPPYIPI